MPGGLHPPLSVISSWRPNYTNPETRGWGIVILVSVLLALCYVVVFMRLWARLRLAKNSGIDDALIVFNLVPLTGLAVSLSLAFKRYGFDKHVWDSPVGVLVESRKITIALEALYMVSTATTKISILLFYRRLATGTISNRFLYTVYAAIGFVVTYFVVFWINLFIGCRPLNAFWNQVNIFWEAANQGKYQCINEPANLLAAAIISVMQDFIACGLPTILFWKLRIPKRQKIALAAIFGVGFFLCICGVLRIVYAMRIYYSTYDMTWESQTAWIWFAIEAHVAVICASAPALKIFFKHALQIASFTGSGRRSTYNRNGNGNSAPTGPDSSGTSREKSFGKMGVCDVTIDSQYDSHFQPDKTSTTVSSEQLHQTWLNDASGDSVQSEAWTNNDIELGHIEDEEYSINHR